MPDETDRTRRTPLTAHVQGYRIVRTVGHGDRVLYTIVRPDGSTCCDCATWADVEMYITTDMARTTAPREN